MLHAAERTGWYRKFFSACGTGTFEPGSDEQETEDWLLGNGGDPKALLLALDSWVNTTAEELASVAVPVLVLTGTEDWHNQTAKALADAFMGGMPECPETISPPKSTRSSRKHCWLPRGVASAGP